MTTNVFLFFAERIYSDGGLLAKDPNGLVVSIVSILVVFIALAILYLTYSVVGKICAKNERGSCVEHKKVEEPMLVEGSVHDKESYVITIRSKQHEVITASDHIQAALSSHTRSVRTSAVGKVDVTSPLPGIIVAVRVKVGDVVVEGQELAVLEAMKMENSIEATCEGKVISVHVSEGESVLEGAALVTIA